MSDARALDASEAPEAGVREQLEALRNDGARAFDAPAFDLAAALLRKADALGGAAGERLHARAAERVRRLREELTRARDRATAALASVPNANDALAEALREGAFGVVLRAARRHAAGIVTEGAHDAAHEAWIARLEAKARARGVHARAATTPAGRAHALASALYDASRGEANATHTALRAEAERPLVAGPYNSQALAAATLAELAALSPAYLAALVAQLSEIGALLLLPPAPTADVRQAPARRRARARGR